MAEPQGKLVTPTGFNPSGVLRALELDASDYLKVALAAWLEGQVDEMGYIGGAWHKQPMNVGYSSRVSGRVQVTSTGAGSTTATSAVVPAGEVWAIDSLIAFHDDPLPRLTVLYAIDSGAGAARELFISGALATRVAEQILSPIVLAPGDYMNTVCFALANLSHITLVYWGRKVAINL